MKISKNQFLILIILQYIFIGCGKQACPDEYEMGSFPLLNSSKELYPYKDSIVNIVFRDSMGDEVHAIAKRIGFNNLGITQTETECLDNPDEEIYVYAHTETILDYVSIPALDIGFEVRYRVSPNLIKYEDGLIQDIANIRFTPFSEYPDSISFKISEINILLDQRNNPELPSNISSAIPSLTLLNKEFTNVYSNTIGNTIVEFNYNYENGIVGFKVLPNGTMYVFDRFE
jgi:hypothetical protein